MSYLVLARKWRPQSFEDVTGQEHVVQTLANAIAQDRLAHAFLLCGPRGVGKTTTARLLARALNCEQGPTATPCGSCVPCQEIVAGASVDVVEIDGASNNGVDSVRELRESARYLPQRDRHKVFIIDEVHMLTTAAFNALLKTLEEPPPHVKFVFATTDPQKLPETILSRVQRHNFRRVPASKMVERLRSICTAEGIEISDHALGLVARQADGGMRDALSLLDQLLASVGMQISDAAAAEALGLVDRTLVRGLADALIDRDGKGLIEALAGVFDRGVDPKRLCEELALHLRDLVYVQAIGQAPDGRADSDAAELVQQAGRADPAQLARLFDRVHGAIRELSGAAQPRLALEVALLTALHMAPAQGVANLAARLDAVAAALGGGGPLPDGGGARGPGPAQGGGGQGPRRGGPAPMRAEAQPGHARGGAAAGPGSERSAPGGAAAPAAPAGAGGASPFDGDLAKQIEAMANAKRRERAGAAAANQPQRGSSPGQHDSPPAASMAPRQGQGQGGRAPSQPSPPARWGEDAGEDDEPGGFATEGAFAQPAAGVFDEAPGRVFEPEASPGGCATGECGAEDEKSTHPAGGLRDDPTLGIHERWRLALEALKDSDSLVYNVLAEGRLAWLRQGEVALGYTPSKAFHRTSAENPEFREPAEAFLSKWFSTPTRLRVQAASEDAPASVADENREQRAQREKRLEREAREHPSVLAALAVLGGEIEDIRVLEEG